MKLKRKFDMVTPFEKVLACIITVEQLNWTDSLMGGTDD